MDDKEFMEFHDKFMSLPMNYHQKQIFYLTAKLRYMGARPENPDFEKAKKHLKKNGYKKKA